MSESAPVEEGCDAYMFENQRVIQIALVSIAVFCIPLLLFGKPLYLYYKAMRKAQLGRQVNIHFFLSYIYLSTIYYYLTMLIKKTYEFISLCLNFTINITSVSRLF